MTSSIKSLGQIQREQHRVAFYDTLKDFIQASVELQSQRAEEFNISFYIIMFTTCSGNGRICRNDT